MPAAVGHASGPGRQARRARDTGLTRLSRLVGIAGLGLFVLVAYTPLVNVLAEQVRDPEGAGRADAIVVMGSAIWPDGTLSEGSLRRALQGIILYRKGLAPLLVFSGSRPPGRPSEPGVRAALGRDLGVPPEAIVRVEGARTTREEALGVGEALIPHGVRRVILVTDSRHLPRARRVLEGAGLEVLASTADSIPDTSEEPGDRLVLMRDLAQELLARFYYRVSGYL